MRSTFTESTFYNKRYYLLPVIGSKFCFRICIVRGVGNKSQMKKSLKNRVLRLRRPFTKIWGNVRTYKLKQLFRNEAIQNICLEDDDCIGLRNLSVNSKFRNARDKYLNKTLMQLFPDWGVHKTLRKTLCKCCVCRVNSPQQSSWRWPIVGERVVVGSTVNR